MIDGYLQQSPLAPLGLAARAAGNGEKGTAGIALREHVFRGLIVLRGNAAHRDFRNAVAGVLGATPPTTPNTAAGPDDFAQGARLLWLGPDEWLAVTAPGEEKRLVVALDKALAGQFASVVDTSDGRAAIAIEGQHARDVLMKGCTMDFHPRAFAPGKCAQTLLARAAVLIHCVGPDAFEVYGARSFAEYLWTWIEDAGREFGFIIRN